MIIPFEELSREALENIIKEFVLREGTDYGHSDYTIEEKIEEVRAQLRAGKVVIVFDAEDESLNIVSKFSVSSKI